MRQAAVSVGLLAFLSGCNRHQSALATFGAEAEGIRTITIALVVGAVFIIAIMVGIYWRAVRAPEGQLTHKQGMRLVLWLGGIGPTILLTVILIFALPAMRPRVTAPGDLTIHVEGEQFWWRVGYERPGGGVLVAANEVRVPVGRTVAFELTGRDVIHSFWIPGLAGKMDMIPGRTNSLVARADKPGRYRGVCTEFCGLSHALMAFDVIAMEPAAFYAWLADQSRPAAGARQGQGAQLFAANGCGGCHAIRGTEHDARIGPDLSRYGDRLTLGAGILPPTIERTADFIRAPQDAKPGVRMPAYPQLSHQEARAIAVYLKGLK
ncbi:cytochrome c oxidase subunit II [Sphingomonas spermidinifaciens]|uniref:Cytochrome aa3 subunit 2 n=1 Tax=Sphingomonas spermidinifaciens TaxID=1141889 RepID=A0A2A4B520_9SPHN|nr:cytochrome c oxidase subunit II [Sphingomonas spermidinifaciens]PCD03157.1 cytochrome c oxidase subunit II [Sphingomonas spermidinifaciens]